MRSNDLPQVKQIRVWIIRIVWLIIAILGWYFRGEIALGIESSSKLNIGFRLFIYCTVYIVLSGLAVPGVVLLSPIAGPLFGNAIGTVVVSFVSTIGAAIAFLGSRKLLFGESKPAVDIEPGLEYRKESRFSSWDLLFLRLIPIVPYFAVNIFAGRSKISLVRFCIISQIGMLPATYILVNLGITLPDAIHSSSREVLWALLPLLVLMATAVAVRLGIRFRRCIQGRKPPGGS